MSRFVYMRTDWDCLRCAIATLLRCSYDETIDTTEPATQEYVDEKPGWVIEVDGRFYRHAADWKEQWQAWAAERGLMMVHVPLSTDIDDPGCDIVLDDEWREYIETSMPGEWIAVIRSRTPGRRHLTHVIVMRGAQLLHDPKPNVDGELRFVGGYVFAPLSFPVAA